MIRAFLAGVVIGVAVGWLRSARTPQPVPFSYLRPPVPIEPFVPSRWQTNSVTWPNTPDWTVTMGGNYTTKHPPLQ